MIPLRLHTIIFISFCLLVALVTSQTAHGTRTTQSTIRLIKEAPGGIEQVVFPLQSDTKLSSGYIITPIPLKEKDLTYYLEMAYYGNGKVLILGTAPKESRASGKVHSGEVINALYIADIEGKLHYQLLNPDFEPTTEFSLLPLPENDEGEEYKPALTEMIIDPIEGMNYLISMHQQCAEDKIHPRIKSLLEVDVMTEKTSSEDAYLVQQLGGINVMPLGDEYLLAPHVEEYSNLDRGMKKLQSQNQKSLKVHDIPPFMTMVTPKKFHGVPEPIQGDESARGLITLYSREDIADIGVVTSPIFMGGPEDIVIPHERHRHLTGGHYFFQIKMPPKGDGLIILFHRLHRPTVEESLLIPDESEKPLVLRINAKEATLKSENGRLHGKATFTKPLEQFSASKPFEERRSQINFVKLANMASKWTNLLYNPESKLSKTELNEKELLASLNGEHSPTSELKDTVIFPSPILKPIDLTLTNSPSHTTALGQPTLPINGFDVGPIDMHSSDGKVLPYTIHLSQHSSNAYTATLHQRRLTTPERYQKEQNKRIFSGHTTAHVSLFVEYTGANKMRVRLADGLGETFKNIELDTAWDPDRDKISLLPITHAEALTSRILLPDIEACTQVLSHALANSSALADSTLLLTHLTQEQTSLNTSGRKNAYEGTVASRLVNGGRKIVSHVIKHPAPLIAAGSAAAVTALGAAAFGTVLPAGAVYNATEAIINTTGNLASTAANVTGNYVATAADTAASHSYTTAGGALITTAGAAYFAGKKYFTSSKTPSADPSSSDQTHPSRIWTSMLTLKWLGWFKRKETPKIKHKDQQILPPISIMETLMATRLHRPLKAH